MSNRTRAGSDPFKIGRVHPISDKSKLLWERWQGPMSGAASALNAAISNTQQILARIILEAEGFSPETHLFDMDKLRIVPRPKALKGAGNGTVDE